MALKLVIIFFLSLFSAFPTEYVRIHGIRVEQNSLEARCIEKVYQSIRASNPNDVAMKADALFAQSYSAILFENNICKNPEYANDIENILRCRYDLADVYENNINRVNANISWCQNAATRSQSIEILRQRVTRENQQLNIRESERSDIASCRRRLTNVSIQSSQNLCDNANFRTIIDDFLQCAASVASSDANYIKNCQKSNVLLNITDYRLCLDFNASLKSGESPIQCNQISEVHNTPTVNRAESNCLSNFSRQIAETNERFNPQSLYKFGKMAIEQRFGDSNLCQKKDFQKDVSSIVRCYQQVSSGLAAQADGFDIDKQMVAYACISRPKRDVIQKIISCFVAGIAQSGLSSNHYRWCLSPTLANNYQDVLLCEQRFLTHDRTLNFIDRDVATFCQSTSRQDATAVIACMTKLKSMGVANQGTQFRYCKGSDVARNKLVNCLEQLVTFTNQDISISNLTYCEDVSATNLTAQMQCIEQGLTTWSTLFPSLGNPNSLINGNFLWQQCHDRPARKALVPCSTAGGSRGFNCTRRTTNNTNDIVSFTECAARMSDRCASWNNYVDGNVDLVEMTEQVCRDRRFISNYLGEITTICPTQRVFRSIYNEYWLRRNLDNSIEFRRLRESNTISQ